LISSHLFSTYRQFLGFGSSSVSPCPYPWRHRLNHRLCSCFGLRELLKLRFTALLHLGFLEIYSPYFILISSKLRRFIGIVEFVDQIDKQSGASSCKVLHSMGIFICSTLELKTVHIWVQLQFSYLRILRSGAHNIIQWPKFISNAGRNWSHHNWCSCPKCSDERKGKGKGNMTCNLE
jgi:hypothetical protein